MQGGALLPAGSWAPGVGCLTPVRGASCRRMPSILVAVKGPADVTHAACSTSQSKERLWEAEPETGGEGWAGAVDCGGRRRVSWMRAWSPGA